MPIYPPRNTATKKKQVLDYKIFELLKGLELDESKQKLERKTELVRVAMLNLIKAKFVLTKSYKAEDQNDSNIQLREKLNVDMENWESLIFDEIKEFCIKHK